MKYQGIKQVEIELTDTVSIRFDLKFKSKDFDHLFIPVKTEFYENGEMVMLSHFDYAMQSEILNKAGLVIEQYISQHDHELTIESAPQSYLEALDSQNEYKSI